MKFDDVISELGDFGPYQKRVYFLTCLTSFCVSMQILAGVFIQATPDHRCSLPDLPNDTYTSQGPWHDALVNASIPWDGDDELYDQCRLRRVPGGLDNDTVSCDKWVYSKDPFEDTFVTDTNLVCDKQPLVTYASVILMLGMLFGSLLLGILSDTIGRKKVALISSVGLSVSSVSVAWANSYGLFVVLRFLVSFFGTGMILSTFVMAMELVGPNKRRVAGNTVNLFWSSGLLIEAALAYGLREWKHLQLVICIPCILVFFIYAIFLPESARWLLQKGKTKEASKIILKMAEVNKVALSKKARTLEAVEFEKGDKKIWHVLSSRTLLMRSLIILFNWVVTSMMYYGLSLNAGDLSGNIYLNFVLMAVAELASFIFCLFILDITGRKLLHVSSMILGGGACIATIFPVLYGAGDLEWVTLVLSLVGKFGATAGFAVIYMFTAELFPTVMRNSVIGVGSLCARIGGILSPFIGNLGKMFSGPFGIALPLVVFGGLSVTAGVLVLFLPETTNKSLPETMKDSKNFGR
ncbi:organic cation transporter protein [Plakobranchus ocellatus]|uniref:Organic cation transporter protein n=1 Tax=Plakobranchus ocellatus TaxID=259542 RepID=A0AAV4B1H6_9GAST|nr:organic cation transporter protein [Plakobranchus ocellatus]